MDLLLHGWSSFSRPAGAALTQRKRCLRAVVPAARAGAALTQIKPAAPVTPDHAHTPESRPVEVTQ